MDGKIITRPQIGLRAQNFQALMNFKWVAGHGEGRENPKVARLREQSLCSEVRTDDPPLKPLRPAATRMNAGFPPFLASQTSAIGTMVRGLFPGKPSFRLLKDRANSTHSNFNRAIFFN
jgi:hypothetical protein